MFFLYENITMHNILLLFSTFYFIELIDLASEAFIYPRHFLSGQQFSFYNNEINEFYLTVKYKYSSIIKLTFSLNYHCIIQPFIFI